MISDRPYRAAKSSGEALEELTRGAGTQFDPQVVAAFLAAFTERNTGVLYSPAAVRAAAR
jgi:HD-GYP domain-containing protein (c-di-GMP phosphodiesterase class II)